MLTVRQVEQLRLMVGGSAWGFYHSEQFPADGRFDFNALTVGTDAELKSLAVAVLTDAAVVAGALAKGSTDKLTIGPLTLQDTEDADPVLAAQAKLWANAAGRLGSGQGESSITRLPTVYAGARQGARPTPLFYAPKIDPLDPLAWRYRGEASP